MKGSTLLTVALAVGVVLFLSKGKPQTAAEKRKDLVTWASNKGEFVVIDIFNKEMTDAEIEAAHTYIFDYYALGKTLPPETDLFNKISAIREKYNIFT